MDGTDVALEVVGSCFWKSKFGVFGCDLTNISCEPHEYHNCTINLNSGSLALAGHDLLLNLPIHLIKAFVVTH